MILAALMFIYGIKKNLGFAFWRGFSFAIIYAWFMSWFGDNFMAAYGSLENPDGDGVLTAYIRKSSNDGIEVALAGGAFLLAYYGGFLYLFFRSIRLDRKPPSA